MTITSAAAANHAALVAQLYGEWHGHYVLRQLIDGAWWDVRPLARDEAMVYRCKANEALEVVWNQQS